MNLIARLMSLNNLDKEQCSICLENIIKKEIDTEVLCCECKDKHLFHQCCLDNWFFENCKNNTIANCPLCRKKLIISDTGWSRYIDIINKQLEDASDNTNKKKNELFDVKIRINETLKSEFQAIYKPKNNSSENKDSKQSVQDLTELIKKEIKIREEFEQILDIEADKNLELQIIYCLYKKYQLAIKDNQEIYFTQLENITINRSVVFPLVISVIMERAILPVA